MLAGLALLALAYVLRERWTGPLVTRVLGDWARREFGAELEIERVGGGWWRDVTLAGVSWRAEKGTLRRVERAHVDVSFEPGGVFRGLPGLAVRVRGEGLELVVLGATAEPADAGRGELPFEPEFSLDLHAIDVLRPGHPVLRIDAVRGGGRWSAARAQLDQLELEAGTNRLALHQAEIDLRAGDWEAFVRGSSGTLKAHLPDARPFAEGLPIRAADIEAVCASGTAELSGTLELDGGALTVRRGNASLARGAAWAELGLDLELLGEFSDVGPLGRYLGEELAGRWSGSIAVAGPLRAPVGRFTGHGEELVVRGVPLARVDVDLETDGERVRFKRCEISGPELEAVLRGGVRFDPLELEDVVFNLAADEGALANLLPFPCEHAFLHARLSGAPDAPSGTFEASASGLTVGGLRIDDSEARGELVAGGLAVRELHLSSGETTLEAAGTIQRRGAEFAAELSTLALLWRTARVDLEHGARLRFGAGEFSVEGLALAGSGENGGGARVTLEHRAGHTRGSLEFQDYDAGPVLAPFLRAGQKAGRLRGSLRGELALESELSQVALDLEFQGWTLDERWPDLAGRARGAIEGRTLSLEQLVLDCGAEGLHVEGTLRAPLPPRAALRLAPGPVQLSLLARTNDAAASLRRAGFEPGITATGSSHAALEVTGEWQRLTGSLALAAERVSLGTEASVRVCDLEARLGFGERITLEQAVFAAPSGTIRFSGSVEAPLDVPRALAEPRALFEAPVALDANVDLADITWVAGLSSNVRRTSGQVAGHVSIRGTALEPSFEGRLALREGELRLTHSSTPVHNVAANIVLEGELVRIEALEGEVGGAPVKVSGTIEPFGPFRRMDLALTGQNLLLARDSHLRLRTNAELEISGTPSQLTISGELAIAEGLYTSELSPLQELISPVRRLERLARGEREAETSGAKRFAIWPSGRLADAELDVHLGGSRTFLYKTNLFEASLRPDAWLRGSGAFPVIEGPVYVENGRVTLPSGVLKLTSGLLSFRREALRDPEVQFSAEMRVQRHDVRATAFGRLDALEIELASTPPLATDDLWLLVLTGKLPAARGEEQNSAAMEALAVFLARDALVRWLGDEDTSENLLERFEIDVGAKTSESGQPTGRVLFYLRPQSRRSGRATYLSAEVDEHDRVNYALGIVFRPR